MFLCYYTKGIQPSLRMSEVRIKLAFLLAVTRPGCYVNFPITYLL